MGVTDGTDGIGIQSEQQARTVYVQTSDVRVI